MWKRPERESFRMFRILPEGGPRTVRMPDRHRLAFTKSSVAIGSKGSDPLTFDLSGTSVPDSDNLYCGAICANKGSSVTFENCVFQNGDQLSRWMIHGEYGSVTVVSVNSKLHNWKWELLQRQVLHSRRQKSVFRVQKFCV